MAEIQRGNIFSMVESRAEHSVRRTSTDELQDESAILLGKLDSTWVYPQDSCKVPAYHQQGNIIRHIPKLTAQSLARFIHSTACGANQLWQLGFPIFRCIAR
jgi:hypothetical protein